jgi:hypothetical protein
MNITIASDELNLKKLTKYFFIKHHQILKKKKDRDSFQIIFHHQSLVDLQEFYLEAICPEPKILFNSNKKFTQLPTQLLEIILKRENLDIDELRSGKWEHLVKWGLAQEHYCSRDASQ